MSRNMSAAADRSSEADSAQKESSAGVTDYGVGYVSSGGGDGVYARDLEAGGSLFAKLQRLAGRFGVEQRGIERVPAAEQTDKSIIQVGTLWFSANMVVSSFAIGALALPVFGLGFVDSALTIIFINFLGVLPVCFFSTFGPHFGLRQMVLSRFWFGYWGVKLIAVFNVLACTGWSAVNVIVGAQFFHAVNGNMPGWAGVVTIAAATLVICTFGYRVVHAYERWSWVPMFVMFLVVLGTFAARGGPGGVGSGFDSLLPLASGPRETGAVLSFAASVFGFATGWTSYAADYTVYQPASRPRRLVFLCVFVGLFAALCFTELLGAAVATAMARDPAYAAAYRDAHVGGLLAEVLVPRLGRFGEFCIVLLGLSIVGNNCPNAYSVSLTLQVLSARTQRVPRFLWTFAGTCAYVAVAIPGYAHFESTLESFMLVIAYWLAVYEGIALSEHFFFRRGFAGYRPEDYATPSRLPPGLAAVVAFCAGAAGAALGMSQHWYTGPIGTLCGGDVGFELAFVFAGITYTALRPFEKAHFKR
ncbi:permease for cytosine/purines, uracil, thiamine, allantoin-domain-containing protein [Durotheca rogersii]|uniref:permease for cytosine/purines, uracil, thiamine, allantoin-domain-containing protein n=1 Tax=Durotheca rogersii TaxID=419775 RepID=UPI00221E7160|nr:permease for cytosine/purines, uracil, thiamine, allantoin-domain-containing protein [Durotheca rogersii]KAI5864748.1 permease for cytosine/purines, uracil, thiamine, allantoin-domain-containing protein [Durotheca rogersii]